MKKFTTLICIAGLFASGSNAHEHGVKPEITFKTTKVAPQLYMLQGKGGNLALSIGKDGGLLIDDDYADIAPTTKKAIKALSQQPIKFVINTHWHFDHTGGNDMLGTQGSIIVSHDNVRKRLKTGGEVKAFGVKVEPAPAAALPIVTFSQDMTLHWNDQAVYINHPSPSGHTDGDAVVYFKQANVVHTGDLYFAGMYPFIDSSSGGSMAGYIDAVSHIINNIDHNTKVIPGHGGLSNKAQLTEFRDMLANVYQRVNKMKQQGLSEKDVVAAKPTAQFDSQWNKGFLKADHWVSLIYHAI